MAKVAQAVIDRGGRQHEHGLGAFRVVEQFEQPVVARGLDFPVGVAQPARIAEVVGLVDKEYVGELRYAAKALREVPSRPRSVWLKTARLLKSAPPPM